MCSLFLEPATTWARVFWMRWSFEMLLSDMLYRIELQESSLAPMMAQATEMAMSAYNELSTCREVQMWKYDAWPILFTRCQTIVWCQISCQDFWLYWQVGRSAARPCNRPFGQLWFQFLPTFFSSERLVHLSSTCADVTAYGTKQPVVLMCGKAIIHSFELLLHSRT